MEMVQIGRIRNISKLEVGERISCGSFESIKKTIAAAIFLTVFLICPSLRADIVSVYNAPHDTGYYDGFLNNSGYFGNSFSTGSIVASKISSISVYLGKSGSLTGTLNVGIYYVSGSGTGFDVPTGSSLATASIDASTIGVDGLYTFNFTGANAIDLYNEDTYAFKVDLSGVNFSAPTAGPPNVLYAYKTETGPAGSNRFSSYAPNGTAGYSQGLVLVDVAAVPEPGTLILFGVTMAIGGVATAIRKRRKRKVD